MLSEFRSRLVEGGAEALLLDTLLTLCREQKLLVPRGRQRTDSTNILGAVRSLNRLGCAIETMWAALDALAVAAPDWLRGQADAAWAERYGKPADDCHVPLGDAARRACAGGIGRDGDALLVAIAAADAPAWLRELPAVGLLRRVWIQNFCLMLAEAASGKDGITAVDTVVRRRTTVEGFPTSLLMVASLNDPEMPYAKKRSTTWIGYKVHLTEICDEDRPHLITHVGTALAPFHHNLRPARGVPAACSRMPFPLLATSLIDPAPRSRPQGWSWARPGCRWAQSQSVLPRPRRSPPQEALKGRTRSWSSWASEPGCGQAPRACPPSEPRPIRRYGTALHGNER